MKRHSKLVQNIHQVRNEVAEGHRESVARSDVIVWVDHTWVGPDIRKSETRRGERWGLLTWLRNKGT
jgi:hypothetical protein